MNNKAISWLSLINDCSGIPLDEEILEELAPYRQLGSYRVYRGLSFKDMKEFIEKTHLNSFPKEKDRLNFPVGIHWSHCPLMAKSFADREGEIGLILWAEVCVDDIVVDIDLLPNDIKKYLEWTLEKELILRSSPKSCEVLWIKTI